MIPDGGSQVAAVLPQCALPFLYLAIEILSIVLPAVVKSLQD